MHRNDDRNGGISAPMPYTKAIAGRSNTAIQNFFDEYGKTHSSRVLGTKNLMTTEPANAEAILKTKWEEFIARPARTIPVGGLVESGMLTADGELRKQHCKSTMPSFGWKALEDLSIYSEHFDRSIRHVPRDGRSWTFKTYFSGRRHHM
jgi:hypothetical protein